MGSYQVLFSGEVSQQANEDAVRDNLARELGIDDRKARQLFSGRTVVIKSQLKHEDALQLQQQLGEFGAICRVKDLTPKNTNVADFRVGKAAAAESQATLRDITAAHSECPRCGHMQLEASHCARCGVDIAAATRQQHKEDLIIEKKIRDLRLQKEASGHNRDAAEQAPTPAPITAETPRHRRQVPGIGRAVLDWFKKSS